MLVYVYDDETKEFLYSEEAHLDPLETQIKGENVYLLPANATFKKPIEKEDGKAVVYSEDIGWKLVDDNRGKYTIKDNQIEEIKTLNDDQKVISDEELEGLNNGTLIIIDNEIVEKPAPTKEEVSEIRKRLYTNLVDPITAHINRLRDEEQTEEVIAQIEALKIERAEIVAKIKAENPYPTE